MTADELRVAIDAQAERMRQSLEAAERAVERAESVGLGYAWFWQRGRRG